MMEAKAKIRLDIPGWFCCYHVADQQCISSFDSFTIPSKFQGDSFYRYSRINTLAKRFHQITLKYPENGQFFRIVNTPDVSFCVAFSHRHENLGQVVKIW
jgi:hypothetical protein